MSEMELKLGRRERGKDLITLGSLDGLTFSDFTFITKTF